MISIAWLVSIAVLGPSAMPARGAPSEALRVGLHAYFRGDFDTSAIELKRAAGGVARERSASSYFLGRSFRQLELRGLALHYLGQIPKDEEPWSDLARLETLRIYFEAGDYTTVLRIFDDAEGGDGEMAYLAGIAAAMTGRWDRTEPILEWVRSGDPLRPFADYTHAQARAAREDLDGAVDELRTLIDSRDAPEGLRERAKILLGKILYLLDRDTEAREIFSSVRVDRGTGIEVLRGLLLTGAGVSAAAEVSTEPFRSADLAKIELVKAAAAEEKGDIAAAAAARERLRDLVQTELAAVGDLSAGGERATALERDLAVFAARLRYARWRKRAEAEWVDLPKDLRAAFEREDPREPSPYLPRETSFYRVWERTHSNPWLRGVVDLRSRTTELARAIEGARAESDVGFWEVWRDRLGEPRAGALLVLRMENLRARRFDHLFTFDRIDRGQLSRKKKDSVIRTIGFLRGLYLGEEPPAEVAELADRAISAKRIDIDRLLASIPERATDPVLSILGNVIEYLESLVAWAAEANIERSDVASLSRALEQIDGDRRDLEALLAQDLAEAWADSLKGEKTFYLRVRAANEAALASLWARTASGELADEKEKRP